MVFASLPSLPPDLTFVRDFFRKDLALDASTKTKRSLFSSFVLDLLPSPAYSSELKTLALRHLILPLLAATFENPSVDNSSVVDAKAIEGLIQHAFHPKHFDASQGAAWEGGKAEERPLLYSNGLLVELHKLATLLIEYMGRCVLSRERGGEELRGGMRGGMVYLKID